MTRAVVWTRYFHFFRSFGRPFEKVTRCKEVRRSIPEKNKRSSPAQCALCLMSDIAIYWITGSPRRYYTAQKLKFSEFDLGFKEMGKNYHNNRRFQERLCSGPPCCLELGFTCYFSSYLKPQVDTLLAIKPSVKNNLNKANKLELKSWETVYRPAWAVVSELFNCPSSLSKTRRVRKKMSLSYGTSSWQHKCLFLPTLL